MQHYTYVKYTGKEEVFVEAVRTCGDFTSVSKPPAKASILFRLTVIIIFIFNYKTITGWSIYLFLIYFIILAAL